MVYILFIYISGIIFFFFFFFGNRQEKYIYIRNEIIDLINKLKQ